MTASPFSRFDPDDSLDVELYCRASTTTASAVERYADRIEKLREAGVVEDVSVTTWPSRIDLTTGDDELVEACERFERWAETNDLTLRPAFDRREITSEFTSDRPRRALVTPVACLAAYDDDLVAVYPHTDVDRTRTVEDALDAITAVSRPDHETGSATGVESSDG